MHDPERDELVVTSVELPEGFFSDDSDTESMPPNRTRSLKQPRGANGQFISKEAAAALQNPQDAAETAAAAEAELHASDIPSTSSALIPRSEMGMVLSGNAGTLEQMALSASQGDPIEIRGDQWPEAVTRQIQSVMFGIAPAFENTLKHYAASPVEFTDQTRASIRHEIGQQLRRYGDPDIIHTEQSLDALVNGVGQQLVRYAQSNIPYTNETVNDLLIAAGNEFTRMQMANARHTNTLVVGTYQDLSGQLAQYTNAVTDHANSMFTQSHAELSTQVAQTAVTGVNHTNRMFTASHAELSTQLAKNTVDTVEHANRMFTTSHVGLSTQLAKNTVDTVEHTNQMFTTSHVGLSTQLAKNTVDTVALTNRLFTSTHAELSEQIAATARDTNARATRLVTDSYADVDKRLAAQERAYRDLREKYNSLEMEAKKSPAAEVMKRLDQQQAQYKELQEKYDNLIKTTEERTRHSDDSAQNYKERIDELIERMERMSTSARPTADHERSATSTPGPTPPPRDSVGAPAPAPVDLHGETHMANESEIIKKLQEDNAKLKEGQSAINEKLEQMMKLLQAANEKTAQAPVPTVETSASRRPTPARPAANRQGSTPLNRTGDAANSSGSDSEADDRPWLKRLRENKKRQQAANRKFAAKTSAEPEDWSGSVVMSVPAGRERAAEKAGLVALAKDIHVCPPKVSLDSVPDEFKTASTSARVPAGSIVLKTDVGAIIAQQRDRGDGSHTVKDCGGYYVRDPDVKAWVAPPHLTKKQLLKFPKENLPKLPAGTLKFRDDTMNSLMNVNGPHDPADAYIELDVRKGEHIWMETLGARKEETGTKKFKDETVPEYRYYLEPDADRVPFRKWDPEYRNRSRESDDAASDLEHAAGSNVGRNLQSRAQTRERSLEHTV